MNTIEPLSQILSLCALAIPATLLLAAVAAPRRAGLAAGAALAFSLCFTLGSALAPRVQLFAARADAVTCVMLLLVASLGAIIVRYSRTYLHGEPGILRYQRWLLLTLGAVTALVLSDNLLVVALGWTATSLSLHQLLTFYADRTPALVAAHKKFLLSRLADGCLLACLALVWRSVGSFELARIDAWVEARPQLTDSMQLAAVLLVVAVALRSAQLPFHGWLMQVMEAPTPVSALLHAGVVNIGGFVLIRVAPWIARAELAQTLLVAIGLLSAVLGSLVMTTRVSVKVALAWSTCAQLGFMLVQCGLGLWHLALLHLVAHSLYKAHSFLSAGSAVDAFRQQAWTPRVGAPSRARIGSAAFAALGCTGLALGALGHPLLQPVAAGGPSVALLASLVGLSIVPLVLQGPRGRGAALSALTHVSTVIVLYVGWHAAALLLWPVPHANVGGLGFGAVMLALLGLFALKAALQLRPRGALARALHPWLFAGFYLDEAFTRLAFRLWPPRLQAPSQSTQDFHFPKPAQAQA